MCLGSPSLEIKLKKHHRHKFSLFDYLFMYLFINLEFVSTAHVFVSDDTQRACSADLRFFFSRWVDGRDVLNFSETALFLRASYTEAFPAGLFYVDPKS